MGNQFFRAAPALLALALAACGGTAANGAPANAGPGDGGSGDGGSAGGASAPSLAQSTLARVPGANVPPSSMAAASNANNAFAIDLFAHVRGSAPAGNLLTSPISASLALTMTYAGAKGATATQMATALHFGTTAGSTILEGQNEMSQLLAQRAQNALEADMTSTSNYGEPAPSSDDYALQVVNSVWGQKSYPWDSSFLDVLAQNYGAGIYQEDFAAMPDPARLAINAWVSESTANKINDLLPSGSIDGDTRMVLANAVHLKLPWVTPFPATGTMPGTFTTASGAAVSVPFMNLVLGTGYVDDGQAQIVELPLAGDGVRVLIALPHGDLATYESGLTPTSAAFAPIGSAQVTLSLPKVSFTSPSFSLSAALKAMGMADAFDGSVADFTGMCAHPPDGNLYVSDVLQKAMLAMQESGVEAAAATAVIVSRTVSAEPPLPEVTMVVNRPFLVAIVDLSGPILFLGHIADPTATGAP